MARFFSSQRRFFCPLWLTSVFSTRCRQKPVSYELLVCVFSSYFLLLWWCRIDVELVFVLARVCEIHPRLCRACLFVVLKWRTKHSRTCRRWKRFSNSNEPDQYLVCNIVVIIPLARLTRRRLLFRNFTFEQSHVLFIDMSIITLLPICIALLVRGTTDSWFGKYCLILCLVMYRNKQVHCSCSVFTFAADVVCLRSKCHDICKCWVGALRSCFWQQW